VPEEAMSDPTELVGVPGATSISDTLGNPFVTCIDSCETKLWKLVVGILNFGKLIIGA